MNDNQQKCYKQQQESKGHTTKDEDEFLYCMFVCNSNNNRYKIHSALCFLKMLKPFSNLYFKYTIAHLWYTQPVAFYFVKYHSELAEKETCRRFTTCLCTIAFDNSVFVNTYIYIYKLWFVKSAVFERSLWPSSQ